MSKVNTLLGSFKSFVSKYANEAAAIANALDGIVSALPIQHADKAKIRDIIDHLETVPASINDWLANAPAEPVAVRISKKDIETAVAAQLPAIINDMVTKAVAEALADQRAKYDFEAEGRSVPIADTPAGTPLSDDEQRTHGDESAVND